MNLQWRERSLYAECHFNGIRGLALAQFGQEGKIDHVSAEVILPDGRHIHPQRPKSFVSFEPAKAWIEETILRLCKESLQ